MQRRKRLGLDMGCTHIKCVEVTGKGRNLTVTAVGKVPTPGEAIRNGALRNPAHATDALATLLKTLDISSKRTVIGLSCPEVLVKRHNMPPMTDKELSKALEFELPDLVNFPMQSNNDVSYSFEVLHRDESQLELLFVACERSLIDPYLDSMKETGLEASVLDLSAFNWPRIPGVDERVCFVDLGEEHTTLYVELNQTYKVYRILPIGGIHFIQGIMQAFECDAAAARQLLKTRHLDELLTQGHGQRSTLRSVFQQYVAGILQTLDFLRAEERARQIQEVLDKVYLIGGLAHLEGLATAVEEEIGLKVEVLNPFAHVSVAEDLAIPDDFASYASALALALRGFEE